MSTQSIYNVILENLNSDGKLPHNFLLPFEKVSPNEISFMPGAKDSIGIFHFRIKHPAKVADKIVKLMKSDWKKGTIKSQCKIAKLLNKHSSISVIDLILNSIISDHNGIDTNNFVDYACRLAFQTTDKELVKLGIGLLGLFELDNNQDIIDKLLVLVLHEEFTLYVVEAVSNYTNGNDIIFQIAQKAEGWGKIHAVECLEPASEEIREWILRKGCANSVMDAYLGLECANKGDLISVIRRNSVDAELFESISIIILALLDEGPVEGISAYEYAEEVLQRYLIFAYEHAVTIIHLWYILNLQGRLEYSNLSNKDELRKMCDNIVSKESWQELICRILKNPDDKQFFYASNVASRLNLDVS